MSKQAEKTDRRETAGELVLPDESDRIIADLRTQLHSLQQELSTYRRDEAGSAAGAPMAASGAGAPPPMASAPGQARSWSDEWAPEIAARLNAPAQDLTQRLERVIAQVQDPALRGELETCLETAFYLFATFRHIADNQSILLSSLEQSHGVIELGDLRDRIQSALAAQGMSTAPDTTGDWPGALSGVPESIVTVVATVARIAQELVGRVIRVTLHVEQAQTRSAATDGVCITIACARANGDMKAMDSAAQLVFKPGVSAITVVDWLYMEKVVELKGGSLRLYHRGDRAAGFQVRVPLDASDPGSAEGE